MPYRDQFSCLMLREKEHRVLTYWQSIGICHWKSYDFKTILADIGSSQSSDKDILLGEGDDRHPVEGICE
jgi:hypothetical protein